MQHLISHSGSYFHVREDYLDICDRNLCAAQILDLLEYWTGCRVSEINRIKSNNAEVGTAYKKQVPEIWLRESLTNFAEGLLGSFKEKSIRAALKLLEVKGYITKRPVNFLSTIKEFRLNVSKVQQMLDEWRQAGKNTRTAKSPLYDEQDEQDEQERQKVRFHTAKTPDENGENDNTLYINNNQKDNSPSNLQDGSESETTSALSEVIEEGEAPVSFSEPDQEKDSLEPENLESRSNIPPCDDEEILEVEIVEEGSAIVVSVPEAANQEKKYSLEVERTIAAYEKLGVIPRGMELNKWAEEEIGSTVALYRKSGAILKSSPNDIDRDFIVYLAKKLKNKENTTGAIAWIRAMEESPKRWQELTECVSSWQREKFLGTDEGKAVKRAYNKASNSFLSEHEDLGIFD
jgi:hypothetical protein